MLFLAGFLEHLQKGFLSIFLYVLSSMYQQEVRQREKTLISNVIPEQVQDGSLLQIDCHVILCNWLSIPLEFLLAFVSLAMIVFVTRTIFVFVGKLLSTYATIVCRYICAFCNDCICFQNNLCICACWQVVGCHSDRSDGTLVYLFNFHLCICI